MLSLKASTSGDGRLSGGWGSGMISLLSLMSNVTSFGEC